MRIHVELEDGKSETVFIPANAIREANRLELAGADMSLFCAWWAFDRRGLVPTDVDDWEQFGDIANVSIPEDDDPKA